MRVLLNGFETGTSIEIKILCGSRVVTSQKHSLSIPRSDEFIICPSLLLFNFKLVNQVPTIPKLAAVVINFYCFLSRIRSELVPV